VHGGRCAVGDPDLHVDFIEVSLVVDDRVIGAREIARGADVVRQESVALEHAPGSPGGVADPHAAAVGHALAEPWDEAASSKAPELAVHAVCRSSGDAAGEHAVVGERKRVAVDRLGERGREQHQRRGDAQDGVSGGDAMREVLTEAATHVDVADTGE